MPTLKEIARGFEKRLPAAPPSDAIQVERIPLSEAEQDFYNERAAIMEFDGGLSRAEAERQALERLRLFTEVRHANA